MKQAKAYIFVLFVLFCMGGKAQNIITNVLPENYQRAVLEGNDTIAVIPLREVVVFPEMKFKNERERRNYTKLVRDVKRTYPYAQL
ncbi:MAG: DUF4294 domain-containing protein, partial [Tannerellaceae bacterium]|nr:DUF4294 domain-containing protein [Tannerellaceae bacterium]